ncbi:uncharacterized protein LOC143185142 [Calliopsis andreniformis]|uniref:uncharacterized protein LOC143185142 n=1 Tax=Calliopsis andreniformis TaxID=337506 RepID=UPI003FCE5F65
MSSKAKATFAQLLRLARKNIIHKINKNKCIYSLLQRTGNEIHDIFDIHHYRVLKTYLTLVGYSPFEKDLRSSIISVVQIISSMHLLAMTIIQFWIQVHKKNLDGAVETLPHFASGGLWLILAVNCSFNKHNFRKLFVAVEEEWRHQCETDNVQILDKFTTKGSKIALLYRSALTGWALVFQLTPWYNPLMDIIRPLNETRSRNQVLEIYHVLDPETHFYFTYVHMCWYTVFTVVTINAIDSLNIIISHHISALFAICGSIFFPFRTICSKKKMITDIYLPNERLPYRLFIFIFDLNSYNEHRRQIQKATEIHDHVSVDYGYQQIRQCVMIHKRAIQSFVLWESINRKTFLFTIILNLIGLSAIAFQVRTNFLWIMSTYKSIDNFCLIDYYASAKLLQRFLNSSSCKWYQTTMKARRILQIMQIRSSRPCKLTAAGLYDLNTMNFAVTFKASMSYCTMLLSLKE